MKRTKIVLNLLTVLALIAAVWLGAFGVLYKISGRGGGATGDLHANLATLAVLIALLLQIAVIVLKIKNRQDVKREQWGIVAQLVAGASASIVPRLVPQLSYFELFGLMGLTLLALLALLALAVSWVLSWRGR